MRVPDRLRTRSAKLPDAQLKLADVHGVNVDEQVTSC
jgi:hypothetical protein